MKPGESATVVWPQYVIVKMSSGVVEGAVRPGENAAVV